MRKPDLTYSVDGAFARFYAETPAGVDAWNEIARHTECTGTIFLTQLDSTLQQLREAGYVVAPSLASRADIDELAKELSE